MVAVSILSALLGIALLAVFFLLRHVLMNQKNKLRSDMQMSQIKVASQTYTDLKAVEDASSYTTLGSTEEESPYQVLGESSDK